MRKIISSLIMLLVASNAYAHPIDMDAIAMIESSNNPDAVGASGEIGLYQISPIVLKHFNQVKDNITGWYYRLCRDDFETGGLMYRDCSRADLFEEYINHQIASWYLGWLSARCGTVDDILIAWNRGYGNWRKWVKNGRNYKKLPKVTQDYLKKYEKLTGEKL